VFGGRSSRRSRAARTTAAASGCSLACSAAAANRTTSGCAMHSHRGMSAYSRSEIGSAPSSTCPTVRCRACHARWTLARSVLSPPPEAHAVPFRPNGLSTPLSPTGPMPLRPTVENRATFCTSRGTPRRSHAGSVRVYVPRHPRRSPRRRRRRLVSSGRRLSAVLQLPRPYRPRPLTPLTQIPKDL
jgi:hypothetical protein